MNSDFLEEEILLSGILPRNLLNRFFFNKFPIFILFAYSLIMRNYISLFYLCFGLLLLNLEFERYYQTKNKKQVMLPDQHKPLLEQTIKILNYRPFFYHLLLIYSIMVYIFKFIMVCIATFDPELFTKINPNNLLFDYEIFINDDLNLIDILLTFLPNLAIIVVLLSVILFKSYKTVIKLDDLKKSKGNTRLRYIFKPMIGIIVLSFPITNLSVLSLIYISSILTSILFWALKFESKGFFYPYCKILQIFCMITIILQYLATIDSFSNTFEDVNGNFGFDFLGINELNNFFIDFNSFIFCVSVFFLYFLAIDFCDSKKSHQIFNEFDKLIDKYEDNKIKYEIDSRKNVSKKEIQINEVKQIDEINSDDEEDYKEIEHDNKIIFSSVQNKIDLDDIEKFSKSMPFPVGVNLENKNNSKKKKKKDKKPTIDTPFRSFQKVNYLLII